MDNTSVDISIELSQIAGRQRLDSNPFKYQIFFIHNTNVVDVSLEDFEAELANKMKLTQIEVKPIRIKNVRDRLRINSFKNVYTTYDDASGRFVAYH